MSNYKAEIIDDKGRILKFDCGFKTTLTTAFDNKISGYFTYEDDSKKVRAFAVWNYDGMLLCIDDSLSYSRHFNLELTEDGKIIKPFWEVKDSEEAYSVDYETGEVSKCAYFTTFETSLGVIFETRELAEKELALMYAKQRVKKRICELNDGCFIGHPKDREDDDYCSFFKRDSELFVDHFPSRVYPSWQYLKNDELVNTLINEMRDDLITIRSE